MSVLLDVFQSMDYGPAPESPDAVNAWLDEHERKFGLFINNEWKTPTESSYYASFNPATGEKLADTVQAGQPEVDDAVSSGRAVQYNGELEIEIMWHQINK